jgi:hypothetical protein
MSKLEELKPNAFVRGILPDGLITVVSVQWFGSEALEITYKTAAGKVANELLYRHDEPRLEVVTQGRPWSFDGDGREFRLVSEAHRIRLAHLFDPVLAVHTSVVEPLPHQISSPEVSYQSLHRRRERPERKLRELELLQRGAEVATAIASTMPTLDEEDVEDLEETPDDEVQTAEEEVLDQSTAARTIAELNAEIGTLKRLGALAQTLPRSGE